MRMIWNAEADAKLLLGVLEQIKDAKIALDNKKLAEFMGPDCLPGAVVNRIVRLKRKGGAEGASTGTGTTTIADSGEGEEDAGGASDATLQKRKVVRKPRVSAKKVKSDVKTEIKAEDEEDEE
ncbi:hypothetical protein BDV12DRAFT_193266 [Aspergillus spectabilis]